MKKKNYNIKTLILVVVILVLIDSVIFIMTDGFGKNLIAEIAFCIVEILVTLWIIEGKEIFKNKKHDV